MHTVPDDDEQPWWRRAHRWAVEHDLYVAFAIMTACAAAGYVAGYRDGGRDR